MADKKPSEMTAKEKKQQYHLELVKQMLTLTTTAFGIIPALAWNTVVQTFINDFVKPYIPQGGSVILSQLIYALIITTFVVAITLQLSGMKNRLEKLLDKE